MSHTSNNQEVYLREEEIDAEYTHHMCVEVVQCNNGYTRILRIWNVSGFVILDGILKPA